MFKRRLLIVIVLLIVSWFVNGEMSAQCAMCKQSAESSLKNSGSIARGLNTGILYLMAVPYLAIMFIFRKQLIHLARKLFSRFSKA